MQGGGGVCWRCKRWSGWAGDICAACKPIADALGRFRQWFLFHTQDGILSPDEWQHLRVVAEAERLTFAEAMLFIQQDAVALLDRTLALMTADGVITDLERQYFQELQRTLAIPEQLVAPLLHRHGLTGAEHHRRQDDAQHRQIVDRQLSIVAAWQQERRPAEEWLRWRQAEEQRRELAAQEEYDIAEAERHRVLNEELRLRAEERRQKRHDELTARFGAKTASRIMAGEIWQGQTAVMLVEALGVPAEMETQVMKTKTKVVLKYESRGGHRYALRVTLEQDVVVGWEDKR